jgi:hypothetical protein
MLATSDLLVLGEELVPPVGYTADGIVAATYSLDLPTALVLPLAIVRQGAVAGETADTADRYATLEAITRFAPSLRIFYDSAGLQAGRWSRVLEAIGKAAVPVAVPKHGQHRPAFHPKLVLVRFTSESGVPLMRLLCMSRNLTGDAALDVSVVLDGEVEHGRRAAGDLRLAAALRRLPGWAVNPSQGDDARALVERMADSVARVSWRPPKGFRRVQVWPMGFEADGPDPLASRSGDRRRLVISPFLRDRRLRELAPNGGGHVLISEETALDAIPSATLDSYEVYRIDPNRTPGGSLHAKVYVAEGSGHRRWFIGSANATIAAAERNAELVVELETSNRGAGVDDLLHGEEGVGAMLIPYGTAGRELTEPSVPTALESLLRELTVCQWTAVAKTRDDGTYDVEITAEPSVSLGSAMARVWFNNDHKGQSSFQPGATPSAVLRCVRRRALSRFLTLEVSDGDQVMRRRVVVTVEGVDMDVLAEDALASAFREDGGLDQLRYFERLLSGSTPGVLSLTFDDDEDAEPAAEGGEQSDRPSRSATAAILEPLLAALEKGETAAAKDPVLQSLSHLVDAGRDKLPEDFVELWESTRRLLGL